MAPSNRFFAILLPLLASHTLASHADSSPAFIRLGKVHPESSLTHISVNTDLSPFPRHIKSATTFWNKTQQWYLKTHQTDYPAFYSISKVFDARLSSVNKIYNDLADTFRSLKNTRSRRSINVNVDLSQAIGTVFEGLSNLVSGSSIKQLRKNQDAIIAATSQLEADLRTATARSQAFEHEIAKLEMATVSFERTHRLDALSRNGLAYLEHLEGSLVRLSDALLLLNAGRISPAILSTKDANIALAQLERKVTAKGQHVAIKHGFDIFTLAASFTIDGSHLHVLVHIPAYEHDRALPLYEWPNLPIFFPPNLVQITNVPRFMGLSTGLITDRRAVFMDSMTDCLEMRAREWVCPHAAILKNVSAACLPALFLSPALDPKTTCQWKTLTASKIYHSRAFNDQMVIFFPHPTRVATICGANSSVDTFSGTVVTSIKPGCTIDTPSWKFTAPLAPTLIEATIVTIRPLTLDTLPEIQPRHGRVSPHRPLPASTRRPHPTLVKSPPPSMSTLHLTAIYASLVLAVLSLAVTASLFLLLEVRTRTLESRAPTGETTGPATTGTGRAAPGSDNP